MRLTGWGPYIKDQWNISDLIRVFAQLYVNVRFFLRDDNVGSLGWTSPGCVLNGSVGEFPLTDTFWDEYDGVSSTGGRCYLPRALMAFQAIVGVTFAFRLLYFFRANLTYAALVHTLFEIAQDVVPFMVMLIVIFVGFSYSLFLLLRHSQGFDDADSVWCAALAGPCIDSGRAPPWPRRLDQCQGSDVHHYGLVHHRVAQTVAGGTPLPFSSRAGASGYTASPSPSEPLLWCWSVSRRSSCTTPSSSSYR